MLKKALALSTLFVSIGATAAILPFTYDFGFIGSEDGFSGSGSFTVATAENLVAGAAGLEAFEFAGLCAGYECSFDLADVTTTGNANWSVNETTGELSKLAIRAYGFLSEGSAGTRLFIDYKDMEWGEIYLECWDQSNPGSSLCNGDNYDYRAEPYPGAETYVTLRQDAPVVPIPIPASIWLISSALLGLGIIKRKKTQTNDWKQKLTTVY